MKPKDHVKVLTSIAMPDTVGVVREITNQGRVVVEFSNNRVGFYTLGSDEFEIVKEA
jgi:hypothetical protein